MSVAIVIPVYKTHLEPYEITSLNQCYRILINHSIFFVTSDSLSLNNYPLPAQGVRRFKDDYFKDISGYNRLMLSAEFYESFKNYDFILLYQLDAFVFRDELPYWCQLDYDYIGAPWFTDEPDGSKKIWRIGNGGFSLRKVQTFLECLNQKVFYYDLSLFLDRKSTRLNSSHIQKSRMPSSA